MALDRKRVRKIILLILIVFLLLFIFVVYLRYLDLKKVFIAKVSERATLMIGQEVQIEDLSISPSAVINLSNITINNPKDFVPGKLLRIKNLRLVMRLSKLLKGQFSFRNIVVYSPELTLMKDGKGRLNISDALLRFLSEKSTGQYQVDEFGIDSGIFDFNGNERYRSDPINFHLKNLSSDPGTKTGIKGTVAYAGNRIQIDGWTYLNDSPKKFNISISSEDFALSTFRKYLEAYKIYTEKTRINIGLSAEGDTERGFRIASNIQVKRVGFSLFTKEVKNIRLQTNATFSFRDYSLVIKDASLYVNNASVATFKGVVTDLKKNPSYRAEIKIDRLDLSRLNFMKDLKVNGILTSDNMHIAGDLKTRLPKVSGSLKLRGGGIESHHAIIKDINADVIFSSDRGIWVKGETSARIVKTEEYLFTKPVEARLSTTIARTQQRITGMSFLTLSPIELRLKDGNTLYFDKSHFIIDGAMKDATFSGKTSFEIMGVRYANHPIPKLKSSLNIDWRKDGITIKDLTFEAGDIKSSANRIRITMQKKINYGVEIRDMSIAYRDQEAELKNGDFYLDLYTDKESISGNLRFSAGTLMIQGIGFRKVSGGVKLDNKDFSLDISRAEVSGGRITLNAQGRISEGPFPIKTNLVVEGIDLEAMLKSGSALMKLPYRVSGDMKRASFEGTINSQDSLNGHAFVEARRVSIGNPGTGRNIVKDALLIAEIEFKGKDLNLKAKATIGTISMIVAGTIKRFMEKDRHIQVKGTLPQVKVADIRNSFWDIFPDSLLYVGLDGFISSGVAVDYRKDILEVKGNLLLKDFMIEGENGEFSIGPINGAIPIGYGQKRDEQQVVSLPTFEKSQYEQLSQYYAAEALEDGFQRITIGAVTYGFRLLENVHFSVKQNGSILNVGRFSANMFGGRLNGSATIDMSNGINYRAGLLVKGLSLSKLCDGIEPIKGFISGKVDGVASFKGSGINISQLIGMADFWTYQTKNEKAMISKEFLHKIGGPSLKAYLGNRPFNKGIMSLYLKNGYLIFKELEISNRNFLGITDLSVKVVPFNNRVALDHLLWTVTEAAERARKKQ